MSTVEGCILSTDTHIIYYQIPQMFPVGLISPLDSVAVDDQQDGDAYILQRYMNLKHNDSETHTVIKLQFNTTNQFNDITWLLVIRNNNSLKIGIIISVKTTIYYYNKNQLDTSLETIKTLSNDIYYRIEDCFNDYIQDDESINTIPLYILKIRCKSIFYELISSNKITTKSLKHTQKVEEIANVMIETKMKIDMERCSDFTHNILIVGPQNSSKNTLFKNIKCVNGYQFELHECTPFNIRSQILDQMKLLIKLYLQENPNNHQDDKIQNAMLCIKHIQSSEVNEKFSNDIISALKCFWNDYIIVHFYQEIKNKSNILYPSIEYFMENIDKISCAEYKTTQKDYILLKQTNNGVTKYENRKSVHGVEHLFKYITMGNSNAEHYPFSNRFNCYYYDIETVIFTVPLSCYNEQYIYNSNTNAMVATLNLFHKTINALNSIGVIFILFFTKYGIFREKLKSIPFTECSLFADMETEKQYDPDKCVQMLYEKFLQKYKCIRPNECIIPHYHLVNATDLEQIKYLIEDVQMDLVKNRLVCVGFGGESYPPIKPIKPIKDKKYEYILDKYTDKDDKYSIKMQIELTAIKTISKPKYDDTGGFSLARQAREKRRKRDGFVSTKVFPLTEKQKAFIQESIERDKIVDDKLDIIKQGVMQLNAIGVDINEEFDRQQEMLKEIEQKMDNVSARLEQPLFKKHVDYYVEDQTELLEQELKKNILNRICETIEKWKAARKLIDNIFADLENMFYALSALLLFIEFIPLNNWE
eukprot:150578_1